MIATPSIPAAKRAMAESRRTCEVLIPLVAGPQGALARVLAREDMPPPHAAQLDPTISDLLENGLYDAGQQAVAALRRNPQRRKGWIRRHGGSLAIANPGDIQGLTARNSASAQLGLGLALALYRAQSGEIGLLATGALDPGAGDARVPVLPVHHLGDKLRLVDEHFRRRAAAFPPRLMLVPMHDPDGTPVTERYDSACAALRELGIEVRSVATFADALRLAGAEELARHAWEGWFRRGLGVAALAAVAVIAAVQWLDRPLTLVFAPVALPDGSLSLPPLRGRIEPEGGFVALPECLVGGRAHYARGEVIAVRFAVAAEALTTLDRRLGLHAIAVGVGSKSGVKVLPLSPAMASPLDPDQPLGFMAPVTGIEEDNLMAILVRRWRPFDAVALHGELRGYLEGKRPGEMVRAAANLLAQRAPGILTHTFTTIGGERPCG